MKPEANETVLTYVSKLREKAKDCEFADVNERILEHLIHTINNRHLIQKALSKQWTLEQFTKEASQIEDINQQIDDMSTTQRYEENGTILKVTNITRSEMNRI
jgi:uncharacterized damage-inducible protein DinB